METGADVLSVDWRIEISDAWTKSRNVAGIQGNLDPALALAEGHSGHIFSLGHGVLKETPPENLQSIVEIVHKTTTKRS